MISFKWLITENISDLSGYKSEGYDIKEDFLHFDGWYSLTINSREWGGIPSCFQNGTGYKPLSQECPMYSDYSILELLRGFLKVRNLKVEDIYVFQPLDLNLIELVFRRQGEQLSISERRRDNKRISWTEVISFSEFCDEINKSRGRFLDLLLKNSPALLNNRYVKEL